tara:strand:+ start:1231 stop:2331 length:1101 start_codon:yes stop_codon:yes gene_type:complete
MSDLPNVSIVTILRDWSQFHLLCKHHWETIDYPKDKLEWILIDDSREDHSDNFPIDDNILYIRVSPDEYLEKIEFPKDDKKEVWSYHQSISQLPNGFKRDYAVGLTSHDYIFHLDIDTLYQPKCIKRKLDFLTKHKLDCVYCKSMLCYDIYGKKVYKTENKLHGYESTLFHTKSFWEKNGFKWSDTRNEAISFYYNKGMDRVMENYYDTIKLLSTHNMNLYQPKQVNIENLTIHIPDIVQSIRIQTHPLHYELNNLFYQKDIHVLGINSEIIKPISKENWKVQEIHTEKKFKEKHLIKQIKEMNTTFDLCILNSKSPVWNIFDSFKFPYILLENEKNREQMHGILQGKHYRLFSSIYCLTKEGETI